MEDNKPKSEPILIAANPEVEQELRDAKIRKIIRKFFSKLCDSEKIRMYYAFSGKSLAESLNSGNKIVRKSGDDKGPSKTKKKRILNAISGTRR